MLGNEGGAEEPEGADVEPLEDHGSIRVESRGRESLMASSEEG